MPIDPETITGPLGDPEMFDRRRGDRAALELRRTERIVLERHPKPPLRTGLRVLATALVVLIGASTAALGAQLTNDDVGFEEQLMTPRVSERGPVVELTGIRPGASRSSNFEIFNPNAEAVSLRMTGSLTGGSNLLYSSLTARVDALSTGESWIGSLGSLTNASVTSHVLAAGAIVPMRLTLSLPRSAGNSYQDLRSEFSLAFAFAEPGKEGDSGIVPPTTEPPPLLDQLAPVSRITSRRPTRVSRRSLVFRGTVLDADSGVQKAELSLRRTVRKRGRKTVCQHWLPSKRRLVRRPGGSCVAVWFAAKLTKKPGGWQYVLPGRRLKKGKYSLIVRATDKAGNVENKFTARQRNRLVFGLR